MEAQKNSNISILVNTTDSFEDCWVPFFTLFKNYWPGFSGCIYLNTETKDFQFPGLNIIAIRNQQFQESSRRPTWSECLIKALEHIEGEIVLYLQEDYFFKAPVQEQWIEEYARLMLDRAEIDCIQLTDQAVHPEPGPADEFRLRKVKNGQRYQISCQAALWRKDSLKGFLRPIENAWQFEEFGSERAGKMMPNFYVVDTEWVVLDKFEIVPYLFTGVIQGRWYDPVVALFDQHGIEVDYSKRGFVSEAPPKQFSKKISDKLNRIPILFRHKAELWGVTKQGK